MFQRVGSSAYKPDLTNTLSLVAYLGNPHLQFKSIHVAGTNGKGSTSHMLASVLQEAGYQVGLYTSPHLKDFRERIKINGQMISKEEVVSFVETHRDFLESRSFSFFEMTVGLAVDFFAKAKVDIAVIEVGMGGRLDSTNIISPEVSVITNIGFDHVGFLGTTLPEIATEKAGIIKSGIPVVIGENQAETLPVFNAVAKRLGSRLVVADSLPDQGFTSDLLGLYQKKNIQTAVATLGVLQQAGWAITTQQIREGLLRTLSNTGLLGRWQVLRQSPLVVADTGHNESGLQVVFQQIAQQKYRRLHLVVGVVADKDLEKILPLFPIGATYYFARPNIPRGLEAEVLKEKASIYGLDGRVYRSVQGAYRAALQAAQPDDFVFVGGSTFVVAEII